ncbi:MAG: hypothetical protein HY717_19545 [Planctomycetes bacterium]|nr:hypothetical protein [Planctomycetota bacterium]
MVAVDAVGGGIVAAFRKGRGRGTAAVEVILEGKDRIASVDAPIVVKIGGIETAVGWCRCTVEAPIEHGDRVRYAYEAVRIQVTAHERRLLASIEIAVPVEVFSEALEDFVVIGNFVLVAVGIAGVPLAVVVPVLAA